MEWSDNFMTTSLTKVFTRTTAFSSTGSLESWVVTLTIAGYPIVAATSQLLGVENRPLSILMRIALLLVCFVLLIRFFPLRIHRKTLAFWLAWWFFWTLYLVRLALDTFLNPTALQLPPSEYALFAIGVCLIPGVSTVLGNVKGGVRFTLSRLLWLITAGIVLNIYVIFFIQGSVDVDPGALRVETEVLNPITLGHLGVSVLLLALWKINDSQPSILVYALSCSAVAVAIIAVISSGSRGPVVSCFVALALYALVLPTHFFSRLTLFGLAIASLLVAFNADILISTFLFERLSEQLFQDDARAKLLGEALELIKTYPFFGAGIEPLETYPHNLVLESFVAVGLLTGLPFCFMLAFAIGKIFEVAQVNKSKFWVCILFIQYLVGAMLSGAIYVSSTFWVLMALTVTLSVGSGKIVSQTN